MRIIERDATNWKKILDFYDALLTALGAPEGHGHGIDALLDFMVWGGMNKVEPPYAVRIINTIQLPDDIRDHTELLRRYIPEHRAEFHAREGYDAEVEVEIAIYN